MSCQVQAPKNLQTRSVPRLSIEYFRQKEKKRLKSFFFLHCCSNVRPMSAWETTWYLSFLNGLFLSVVNKRRTQTIIIFYAKSIWNSLDDFHNFALFLIEFANFNHKFPVMYVANDFSWTERFDKISSFKCWFDLIKSDSL